MIIYREKALAVIDSKKTPNLWLIFGANDSEVNIITKKIIDALQSDTTEAITVADQDVKTAVLTQSLFHTNKIIVLPGATDALLPVIKASIVKLSNNDYLLIQAGELRKNSKLREFFESHASAYALNCYKVDENAMVAMIEQELRSNNLTFDREVPYALVNLLSTDSGIIQKEVEKLGLFFANSQSKRLNVDIAIDVVSCNSEAILDKFFISIITCDAPVFLQEMQKLQGTNCMLVIRSYQNFLRRIISVQKELGKIGIEKAVSNLKPPLFGNNRSAFIEAVKKSKIEDNLQRMQRSIQIECDMKSLVSVEAEQILFQKIMEELCRKSSSRGTGRQGHYI